MSRNKKRSKRREPATEHPNIAKHDWRLQVATTLAEPFASPWTGKVHPAGAFVSRAGALAFEQDTIVFNLPNPAALYLSLASGARDSALEYRASVFQFLKQRPKAANHPLPDDQETPLFDCLQQLTACVVFSHLAVEAFANELLPQDFKYNRERSDKRCAETYDREQTERWVSLDEKLDRILPSLAKVKSPKGTALWGEFIGLEDLRDRCVHLKEGDWDGRDLAKARSYLWSALLASTTLRSPQVAARLIRHFYPNEPPRWLHKLQEELVKPAGGKPGHLLNPTNI